MVAAIEGESVAAKFLSEEYDAVLKSLRESATFSKQPACDQIGEISQQCREAGWDGEDADAVVQETVENACLFIDALPTGFPLPDITAEPDGHINLEWYRRPRRILSVSVSAENRLYWAALVGTEDPRGSAPFYDDIPETIQYWIQRVCAS